MKTKVLFILMLSAMSFCAQAQSAYVRVGLGAAISTAPHMSYNSVYITSGGSEDTEEAKRGGLGDGLPIFAAAGYYFSEHFGVELGIDYFQGFNHKTTRNNNGSIATYKRNGTMLALTPAFVMKIDLNKFKPYARLGLKIGVLNNAKTVCAMSGTPYSPEKISGPADYTQKDYGGIAIGAQAALGTEFTISDLLSLFGEINLDGISWSPKKGKYTKYSLNGVDQLGSMTTKDKTWTYEKKIDYNETIPDSSPDKEVKFNYSFANVGLVIGVKINFGK